MTAQGSDSDETGAREERAGETPPGGAELDPVVALADVGYVVGDVSVLDGVSLAVRPGDVTTMVGPNGSGKTTLATVLAGLRRPTSGTRTVAVDAARPVGYLPQTVRFRPVLTVEETVGFYADLLAASTDPTAAMRRVGLASVADRRVAALSGGMRRLLGIAVALLGDPSLLVLDEPTSGLDPGMTNRVFDVCSAAAREGTAVFVTTHDLPLAEGTDEVAVLDRGRIVAQGSPERLVADAGAASLAEAFDHLVGSADPAVQTGVREDDG